MRRKRTSIDAKDFFTRRAFILAGGKIALTTALIGRLGYLGIIRAPHYKTLADENRIKLQILVPKRGVIYDRFGTELAAGTSNYRLSIIPDQAKNIQETLTTLNQLLKPQEIEPVLTDLKKQPRYLPYTLRDKLTWDEVCKLMVHMPELEGTEIELGHQRHYPLGVETAHLIGFVQAPTEKDDVESDLCRLPDFRIGKTGIEKQFNDHLQGETGYKEVEVNAYRRVVRDLEKQESTPGKDLHLTIDARLQKFTLERLQEVESASVVVLDVKTGEVISMVSSPSFDPNLFVNGIPQKEWQELNTNPYGVLNNKAINGQYSPGSVFKLIVAAAAFESGKIPPNFESNCRGYIEVGNHRFHCMKKEGHGPVSLSLALQKSCDVYFYEVAQILGIDRMAKMAKVFGLGELTGIELPSERSGLVPSRSWKLLKGDSWRIGDTVLTGIGQGAILATPLQLAIMTARLLSGNEIRPTLLKDQAASFPKLEIRVDYLKHIWAAMDEVVNLPGGTGYSSRIAEPGKEMGGKTATTQVRRISMKERKIRVIRNDELPWKERDHAMFVGYAPVHDPRFAISVVVEHGGSGGKIATSIARDTLLEAQNLGI